MDDPFSRPNAASLGRYTHPVQSAPALWKLIVVPPLGKLVVPRFVPHAAAIPLIERNLPVSKTVDGGNVVREFESLPLRLVRHG
jgi:hypothetical protein